MRICPYIFRQILEFSGNLCYTTINMQMKVPPGGFPRTAEMEIENEQEKIFYRRRMALCQ